MIATTTTSNKAVFNMATDLAQTPATEDGNFTLPTFSRKLTAEEEDSEEEEIASVLALGPTNTKQWSATLLRKELGSPRMTIANTGANNDLTSTVNDFFDDNSLQSSDEGDTTTSSSQPETATLGTYYASTSNKRSNRPSLLQELGAALVSCGGGGTGGKNRCSTSSSAIACQGDSHADIVAMATNLKDSLQKAVLDLDQALSKGRNNATDANLNSSQSQDSWVTFNEHQQRLLMQQQQEEEEAQQQIRRLTSWGTVGTFETIDTIGAPTVDDDGLPIDTALLKQSKSKTARRKRVVRFEYPPISSLRECPRTRPEDVKSLFFTEHEQIEDDRHATISADDVEIVAISTSGTTDSEAETTSQPSKLDISPSVSSSEAVNPSTTPMSSGAFRNYVATPSKGSKKGKRNFNFDEKKHRGSGVETAPVSAATATPSPSPSANSTRSTVSSSKRMIKSVQIYLRERSVG